MLIIAVRESSPRGLDVLLNTGSNVLQKVLASGSQQRLEKSPRAGSKFHLLNTLAVGKVLGWCPAALLPSVKEKSYSFLSKDVFF